MTLNCRVSELTAVFPGRIANYEGNHLSMSASFDDF
jgi:hypothetical protein